MTVRHEELVVELDLPAAPARVFAAYADPELRRRWVRMPGARGTVEQTFDLRVGATERSASVFANDGREERLELLTTYLDVDAPDRIVSAVVFRLDDVPRWSSLVTVELRPAGDTGTRLVRTEQLALLAPSDVAHGGDADVRHQRGGARLQLNGLVALLAEPTVADPSLTGPSPAGPSLTAP